MMEVCSGTLRDERLAGWRDVWFVWAPFDNHVLPRPAARQAYVFILWSPRGDI